MKPIIVETNSLNCLVYIAYPQLAENSLINLPTVIECVSEDQYKEVINNILIETKTEDRLAELEALIREWYIQNKKNNESENWFEVHTGSMHKKKCLTVYDMTTEQKEHIITTAGTTTKEMFDKAFEFFKVEEK